MSVVTNTFSISINGKPKDVFAYVSDLTRHSEWNDGLKVESMTPGPPGVGSQYHSWGKPAHLLNEIKITDYTLHGHKLRLFTQWEAQFVTEGIILAAKSIYLRCQTSWL